MNLRKIHYCTQQLHRSKPTGSLRSKLPGKQTLMTIVYLIQFNSKQPRKYLFLTLGCDAKKSTQFPIPILFIQKIPLFCTLHFYLLCVLESQSVHGFVQEFTFENHQTNINNSFKQTNSTTNPKTYIKSRFFPSH